MCGVTGVRGTRLERADFERVPMGYALIGGRGWVEKNVKSVLKGWDPLSLSWSFTRVHGAFQWSYPRHFSPQFEYQLYGNKIPVLNRDDQCFRIFR